MAAPAGNVAAFMKAFFRYSLPSLFLLACVALPGRAAEDSGSATPTALAAPKKHGYTVTVEVKVNEKGETESVQVFDTEDISVGEVLSKMAIAMALKADLPVREKEGKPIRYTARLPFFFPIENDEGPEADQAPKPKVKDAIMPAYPPQFRESGQVGGAVLELVLDAEGNITRLTTLRASHPEFEAAARDAVTKWKFTPAQQDGKPVESRTRLAVAFETGEQMADVRWRLAPRPSLGSFVVIRPDEPITDEEAAPAPASGEDQPAEQPAATK